MLTYYLLRWVFLELEINWYTVVINKKRLKSVKILLPSVVDMSGAGIKTHSCYQSDYNIKIKQSIIISKSVNIFVTFCSGYLWSWNKTCMCHQ